MEACVGYIIYISIGLEEDAPKWLVEWYFALKLLQEERYERLNRIQND